METIFQYVKEYSFIIQYVKEYSFIITILLAFIAVVYAIKSHGISADAEERESWRRARIREKIEEKKEEIDDLLDELDDTINPVTSYYISHKIDKLRKEIEELELKYYG